MDHRSPFERLIVSDERQAASAAPGAWQLRTSTITLTLLLIGAAFGSGIRQTEYPAIAWIAFLAFAVLVATRMSGFDEALDNEKAKHDKTRAERNRARGERDTAQAGRSQALGDLDRAGAVIIRLQNEIDGMRAELETTQALAAELRATKVELEAQRAMAAHTSKLLDRFWSDEPTTIYADPYTGKTEALEV